MRNTGNLIKGPVWWRRWRVLGSGLPQMFLRNTFQLSLKNRGKYRTPDKGPSEYRKPDKGTGVVALVAGFGWWTASDVPKELTFQLWLKISEILQGLRSAQAAVTERWL